MSLKYVFLVRCVAPSGLRVPGAGFRVQSWGLRAQGSGMGLEGSGFRVACSGFWVQGSGFRVQGSGLRVQSSEAGDSFARSRASLDVENPFRYKGISLIRNSPPLGTYSSICLGPYGGPGGGGGFLCARYPCSPESTSHKNYVPDAHERLESGGRLFGPPLDFSVGSTHVMGPTITSHGRESSAPPPLQDQAPATPRRAEGGAPSRTQAVAKLPAPSRAPSPQRLHSFQCR